MALWPTGWYCLLSIPKGIGGVGWGVLRPPQGKTMSEASAKGRSRPHGTASADFRGLSARLPPTLPPGYASNIGSSIMGQSSLTFQGEVARFPAGVGYTPMRLLGCQSTTPATMAPFGAFQRSFVQQMCSLTGHKEGSARWVNHGGGDSNVKLPPIASRAAPASGQQPTASMRAPVADMSADGKDFLACDAMEPTLGSHDGLKPPRPMPRTEGQLSCCGGETPYAAFRGPESSNNAPSNAGSGYPHRLGNLDVSDMSPFVTEPKTPERPRKTGPCDGRKQAVNHRLVGPSITGSSNGPMPKPCLPLRQVPPERPSPRPESGNSDALQSGRRLRGTESRTDRAPRQAPAPPSTTQTREQQAPFSPAAPSAPNPGPAMGLGEQHVETIQVPNPSRAQRRASGAAVPLRQPSLGRSPPGPEPEHANAGRTQRRLRGTEGWTDKAPRKAPAPHEPAQESQHPTVVAAASGSDSRSADEYVVECILGSYRSLFLVLWQKDGTVSWVHKRDISSSMVQKFRKKKTRLDKGVDLMERKRENGKTKYKINAPGMNQTAHGARLSFWVGEDRIATGRRKFLARRRDRALPSYGKKIRRRRAPTRRRNVAGRTIGAEQLDGANAAIARSHAAGESRFRVIVLGSLRGGIPTAAGGCRRWERAAPVLCAVVPRSALRGRDGSRQLLACNQRVTRGACHEGCA
ncbi:hypothetical protein PCL_07025 [Purpureocillium lilacinum]|uniref:Uncharacterized protein n=1 Tax=Purpureocillium lilacinum TaxID=33203 RepID=A0A2U3DT64_PURLI|nr:hypothetical protein PCL_07025 [Purpureocillium lilacinum]